jgi:hypothetical protein
MRFSLLFVVIFSVFLATAVIAEENCICLDGVEFTMEHESYDPVKIEKLQIFGILKKHKIENALINFYDRFVGDDRMEGIQLEVLIVNENGKRFEGSARINKGAYESGLARAVRDALSKKQ